MLDLTKILQGVFLGKKCNFPELLQSFFGKKIFHQIRPALII